MTIQFQLTEPDFHEAAAALQDSRTRKNMSAGGIGTILIFGLVTFAVGRLSIAAGVSARDSWTNVAIPCVSFTVLGLIHAMTRHIRVGRRPSWQSVFGILCLILSLGEFYKLRFSTPPPMQLNGIPPAPGLTILVPHLMWFALMIFSALFSLKHQRLSKQANWEGERWLHYPKKVDISAYGISSVDDVLRAEYQWSAFTQYEESRNLFLFYTGPRDFLILPKRAFAGQEEIRALRELARLINTTLPGGFMVEVPSHPTLSAPIPFRAVG